MSVKSLEALFIEELKDIYDAEHRLTKALPKVLKRCSSEDLRTAIASHLAETEGQVVRLDKVFGLLGVRPSRKTCEAMKGLLAEADEVLAKDFDDDAVKDAGIIAGCRRIEHYEIASYCTLSVMARTLGHDEIMQILQESFDEESAADAKLKMILVALNILNPLGEAA